MIGSVDHSNTNGVAAITEALQAATVDDIGHKVFIGNLNFVTKEAKLKELFGKHGVITEVQIIFRGSRSLGYGFVTYQSLDDAQKAVSTLDKSEIDGRVVNVEIAKPAPGEPGGAAPRAAAQAAKKLAAENEANGEEWGEGEAAPRQSGRRGGYRRGRGGRGRGRGRARRSALPSDNPAPQSPTSGAEENGVLKLNGTSSTDNESSLKSSGGEKTGGSARGGRKPRRGRGGHPGARWKKREGPPVGIPSKTLLFVANLPFSMTDEQLKEVFTGFEVASAHVVKRKYGPATGRSKGFGFVELTTEEDQLKALSDIHGKAVDGRELQVKIAVSEARDKEKANEEGVNGANGWEEGTVGEKS